MLIYLCHFGIMPLLFICIQSRIDYREVHPSIALSTSVYSFFLFGRGACRWLWRDKNSLSFILFKVKDSFVACFRDYVDWNRVICMIMCHHNESVNHDNDCVTHFIMRLRYENEIFHMIQNYQLHSIFLSLYIYRWFLSKIPIILGLMMSHLTCIKN